jgi:hypothetical protein
MGEVPLYEIHHVSFFWFEAWMQTTGLGIPGNSLAQSLNDKCPSIRICLGLWVSN